MMEENSSYIQGRIWELIEEQNALAEKALQQMLSEFDKRIIEAYMAGKLNIGENDLRDLLEYDYETIWEGPSFIGVRRKEKDNG